MSAPPKPSRTIRGQTAEERRQDRRRRLENAALELFGEHGFAGTSVDMLCQRASVSLRTFYDEYGNKDALFVALYDRLLAQLQRGGDAVYLATQSSEDRIRRLATGLVEGLAARPAVGRVLFIEAALVTAVHDRRRSARRAIAELAERAYPELAGRRSVAIGIVGGLIELVTDWLLYEPDAPADALVDRLVEFADVVLNGAHPAPPVD